MTIEFAIVLTGVVALLAAVLLLMSAGIAAIRCVDAAHTAARMSAISEVGPEIEAAVLSIIGSGSGAAIDVHRTETWVSVTVSSHVPNSPWPWSVSHTAHAYVEPGASQ